MGTEKLARNDETWERRHPCRRLKECRRRHAGRDAGAPRFAVWELEDFSMRRGKIYGRACDDLIGVAAALATIIELKSKKARVNVLGVISRAEEIGFDGALACAASGRLPKNSLVISLERSGSLLNARPNAASTLRA